MGRRGPAPKPTVLKKVEGTYRKDREAPNAPEPEPGVPELPAGWGEAVPWGAVAVEEYYAITPWLLRTGLLTRGDRAALLAYCDAWGRWIHYRKQSGQEEDVVMTAKGFQINPTVRLCAVALADMKRFLALFGLSPADRTRVSATKDPGKENPFRGFAAS